ncbi:MAG TPA: hypothetical protein DEA38_02425 [Stenotrophomonas sp.]|jgi:hypothetical protein|nr:hypothetical protein [Stenotrophomonas sp.]
MKNSIGQALPAKRAQAPRERRMDKNTVARPRRVKAAAFSGDPETVEQFEARGGQVQRLAASWEQAA